MDAFFAAIEQELRGKPLVGGHRDGKGGGNRAPFRSLPLDPHQTEPQGGGHNVH
jgi:hypothetical protein